MMNRQQIIDYCRSLPGVTEAEKGEPANIWVFYVGDKKFAYFKTSEPERWRFSLRVNPEQFYELTDQAGIKPARYMQRFHWVSLVPPYSIAPNYFTQLIDGSYQTAVTSLTKKQQRLISGDQK